MKSNTAFPSKCFKLSASLVAVASLVPLSGNAQTIIDGTAPGYTNNGSFESLNGWWIGPSDGGSSTTLSGDLELVRGFGQYNGSNSNPPNPSDGSWYAVIGADSASGSPSNQRGFYLDTGYDLVEGDQFNLSFSHLSHFNADADDEFTWQLFTTTTNTDGGTVSQIVATDQVLANITTTMEQESFSSVGNVTAGMAGDRLWIAFLPSTNMVGDFIGLDEVNLSVIPEPSTFGLLAGGLVFLGTMLRRRIR